MYIVDGRGIQMIVTTERVIVAVVAFGLLFYLQSRSRKVSDRILKRIEEQREQRIDETIESEGTRDYDQFELNQTHVERFHQLRESAMQEMEDDEDSSSKHPS